MSRPPRSAPPKSTPARSRATQARTPRPDAARSAALALLQGALGRRGGLEEALGEESYNRLLAQDRAFARALTMATLRHLGPIDKAIDSKVPREPPEPVRDLLRLGLAQLFHLKTPSFAAVDTTVGLAPKPLRGLVNAVLRGLSREPAPVEAPEDLAPQWLLARWRANYGEADALAIAALIADEPATDLTPRGDSDAALAASLEAEPLPGPSLRTRRGGDVSAWPGFEDGAWWVQDAAAAIPARLLAVQPGETALDLCAAPGGKSLQLAAAGAKVTSVDRSRGRLSRLTNALKRTGLEAEVIAADAAVWRDDRTFDAVLLDAPCSATGTFRRNPDVLWNAKPGDIPGMATSQQRLLAAAARRVAPGGRLVYSVCSLEPEEGESQVPAFLAAHPDFTLDPPAPGEGGAPDASLTAQGTLRILPHHREGGLDGFFIARFRRASASG